MATTTHADIDSSRLAAEAIARAVGAAPAGASVNSLVYRRTWPTPEVTDWMSELEFDPAVVWNGWLDSSLDLRDGLSVVEVFEAPIVADEHFAALH